MADSPTPATVPLSPAQQVLAQIQELKEQNKRFETQLSELKSTTQTPSRGQGPYVRSGEDPFTSRGFSFMKFFAALAGRIGTEDAKVEMEICDKLKRNEAALGSKKHWSNSAFIPFSSQYLAQQHGDESFAREIGEVVRAGVQGYDREEVRKYRERYWGREKALSWVDETQGAALVAPPMMGELVELLRNNEVFMQAGARSLAMPPNGRIVWPRQTGASTAYWVGTDAAGATDRVLTASNPTTGDITLQAKKLGILVKIPNELFRFSSVSIEQFIREDMARVLALKLDKTFLDNAGSGTTPKGLINYSGITTHTAAVVGANGNTLQPEDVAQLIGKVEEQNAMFRAFIMRPLMYTALSSRRADAVAAGDGKGQFLFNVWRELQQNYIDPTRLQVGNLNGYPVFKSTQIDNTRSKGSATNLSYILGGDFTDFLIAMSGSMEFMLSTQGDTPFTQDETWFRGLLLADGAPRHEASFVLCDSLVIG